jgi:probable F420-dependent oxidoreductase
MFDPGPHPYGPPRITLAAVGPLMTKVAGRVADGFVSHAFQTAEYLRDVTLPAIDAGLAEAGRSRDEFEVSIPAFVVTGTTDEETAARKQAVKQQIAFYGSTPAYKGVLDHHGWGEAQPELNRLSKAGRWVEMADVIDDGMLAGFAIVAEPDHLAAAIEARFGGLVDRIQCGIDIDDPDTWAPVVEAIRRI